MKFTEALKLKESLKDKKFKSSLGNVMTIIIAPSDKEALSTWKQGIDYIWNHSNPDALARYYTNNDDFVLYGVRQISAGVYSGGELHLKQHPELIHRRLPNESTM